MTERGQVDQCSVGTSADRRFNQEIRSGKQAGLRRQRLGVCAFTLWAWLAPDAAQKAIFGATGTCRMGSNDDDMSPLDPQLRVKGINNLRVADASVMPQLTAVNPNITCMLIGERAAQLIAGE